ncbi:MAG: LptF/LptG family permease [Candidatus Sumerlaeia bacterium]|nr:LptF/LptG family permease [Candidatus Sumerlaeia bacterium]
MRILQRYVLKELAGPFFLGVFVFTFLLLANKLFRLMDLLVNQGIDLGLVIRLFISIILSLLTLTVPMGVLVSVLIGLGRLSTDRELLAIRINGINLLKIFTPIVLVALLLSLLMIMANFTAVPKLMLQINDLLYRLQFKVLTALEPNRFYDNLGSGRQNITLHFADKSADGLSLLKVQLKLSEEVTEEKKDSTGKTIPLKKRREVLILAKEGMIVPDEESKSVLIQLKQGMIIPLTEQKGEEIAIITFQRLNRLIQPELKRFIGGVYQKQPREMLLDELLAGIARFSQSERKKDLKRAAELERELYQRISIPLSCLAFVLIGIPLALIVRPSGKSAGFAISFALLFVYFALLKWGATLLEEGYSFAWLAIFSPNILLALIGSAMIAFEIRK